MFKIDETTSSNIIELTKNNKCMPINISSKHFFIKKDPYFKELIGYYLAKFLEIKCFTYDLLMIDGDYFVISRDINEISDYTPATKITQAYHELSLIINDLYKLPHTSKRTVIDLLKVYIFDLLFLNSDRHLNNWGIINNDNEYRIIILDNGCIFSMFKPFINFNYDNYSMGAWNLLGINAIYNDLKEFFHKFPEEYLSEIIEMIEKANIENIRKIINKLEKENNISIHPMFLQIYEGHYEKIAEIIKERSNKNAR